MIKLKVPYFSQWDTDATRYPGDCGPTCLKMVLGAFGHEVTVNKLYDYIDEAPRGYTGLVDLRKAAEHKDFNVDVTYKDYRRDTAINELKTTLASGKVSILFVKYVRVWRDKTGNTFDGNHFVVATGCDEGHVLVNDPLFGQPNRGLPPREQGEYFKWTDAELMAGWESLGSQCIVTTDSVEFSKNDPFSLPTYDLPNEPTQKRILSLAAYEGVMLEVVDLEDQARLNYWLQHIDGWGENVDTYKVVGGDSLSKIAAHFYGDATRWQAIQRFNELTSTTIFIDQKLKIPLFGNREDSENSTGPTSSAVNPFA